ncbi:hypothetical protein X801_05499, partial [Opisthorchis viverrini]
GAHPNPAGFLGLNKPKYARREGVYTTVLGHWGSPLTAHGQRSKNVFLKHDVDRSGKFQAEEFREALRSCGYTVSNKFFNALVHRYQDPDTEVMRFEDFMLCVIRLKNVFETSAAQPKTYEGAPMFTTD